MKIMAFDIAGHTGIAFGGAGEIPRSTSVDLGRKKSEAVRYSKMIGLTRKMIAQFEPDLVVYEAPVGGPKTSHFLVGVAACFVGEAHRNGVNIKKLELSSVRRHFLGKHLTSRHFPHLTKAKARIEIKRAVVARCHQLGWDVDDDDEADACALWDYAQAVYGRSQSAPLGELFNGH